MSFSSGTGNIPAAITESGTMVFIDGSSLLARGWPETEETLFEALGKAGTVLNVTDSAWARLKRTAGEETPFDDPSLIVRAEAAISRLRERESAGLVKTWPVPGGDIAALVETLSASSKIAFITQDAGLGRRLLQPDAANREEITRGGISVFHVTGQGALSPGCHEAPLPEGDLGGSTGTRTGWTAALAIAGAVWLIASLLT